MITDWNTFPFALKLHIGPFIEHVRKIGESDPALVSPDVISRINQIIDAHPELMELIDDFHILDAHKSFLKDLFSTLIPLKGTTTSLQAITVPFTVYPFLVATETYEKIVTNPEEGNFIITEISISGERLDARILYAYKAILKKFYDLDLKVDQPIIAEVCLPTPRGQTFALTNVADPALQNQVVGPTR